MWWGEDWVVLLKRGLYSVFAEYERKTRRCAKHQDSKKKKKIRFEIELQKRRKCDEKEIFKKKQVRYVRQSGCDRTHAAGVGEKKEREKEEISGASGQGGRREDSHKETNSRQSTLTHSLTER